MQCAAVTRVVESISVPEQNMAPLVTSGAAFLIATLLSRAVQESGIFEDIPSAALADPAKKMKLENKNLIMHLC